MDLVNRTFIGVRVPAPQLEQIQEKLQLIKRKPGVDNVRWHAPSELFLNLISLGELGIDTLHILKVVLKDAARDFPRLNLEITGFGGSPNMIQPRYVFASIGGPDAHWLSTIAAQLDQATRPHTPHRESKPFQSHILLGRLKTENETFRVNLGRALRLAEQPDMGPWPVNHLELLISSASEGGIGFTVIEQAMLGG